MPVGPWPLPVSTHASGGAQLERWPRRLGRCSNVSGGARAIRQWHQVCCGPEDLTWLVLECPRGKKKKRKHDQWPATVLLINSP